MRALFLFVFCILMMGSSYANSRLPACQGEELVQWSNCYGTYEYDNGTVYTGDFKNNAPNGNGSMTNPNGNQYVGSWQNGYRHGPGIQTFTDGRQPQRGLWLNDNLIRAEQVEELNRTAQVEVDINRSKKDMSTLPKCKGIKQNSWWNDCFGIVNYPSGARYIGEFKNHEQDGMGIFIDKDYQNANAEVVKEGLWSNGRFIKSTRVNLPLEYVSSLNSTNTKIKNEAPLLSDGKKIIVVAPSSKPILQQQDSSPTLISPIVGKINELVSAPQLSSPAVLQSASGKRVALVIGNGDYKSVPKLN